jgi:stage V sporulation protein SpoVS
MTDCQGLILVKREARRTVGISYKETAAMPPMALHHNKVGRKNVASECRNGVIVSAFALLLGIGGLITSAGYGQGPQEQDRSLGNPSSRFDMSLAAITERLLDQHASVRQAAVFALQAIGPKATKAAIPALAELLRDKDQIVRVDASHALVSMGPKAVPSLVGLLYDEDARVRELAARTLREFESEAKAATPALTERLGDRDASVRQAAVFALQAIGPKATKAAIPALAELLRDKDRIVRIDASHALVRMGPDAVPIVAALLHDADARVRELAMQTLQDIEKQ